MSPTRLYCSSHFAKVKLLLPMSTFCYCQEKQAHTVDTDLLKQNATYSSPPSKELSCVPKSADFHIHMFKAAAPTTLKVSQA